jgi:hypothetical protein
MNQPAEDEIELAELQRALLDEATLDDLLADIETLCTIESVALKYGAEAHAETSATLSVTDVRPALARGAAVQLRYAYRGERWCDTLLPGMSETLLVRMRERG